MTFDYLEDLEDLGKNMDKVIRKKLSKKECDSIFLATTEILEYINMIKGKDEILDLIEEIVEE